MKFLLSFLLAFSAQSFAASGDEVSQTLLQEWERFRAHVEMIEADGDVGGYMDYKDYDGVKLLWRVSSNPADNEVIRFYIERPGDYGPFAITYHKSSHIVDGKTVIRRFVGPEPSGWINHTIDYVTGEYLGRQGYFPSIRDNEMAVIEEWGIRLLDQ